MQSESDFLSLLGDALQQTIANPTASYRWHSLMGLYAQSNDESVQSFVRQRLLDTVPKEGIAGFFMMTLLAELTKEQCYIAEAGRIVQDILPYDMERVASHSVFEWGRALAKVGDRSDFVTALRDAGLPEIMACQGRHLVDTLPTNLASRPIVNIARVAVVVSYLSCAGHTPTVLAMQYASIFAGMGIEVHIFSSQELRIAHMGDYLGNRGVLNTPPPDMDELRTLIPPSVSVTMGREHYSLLLRSQHVLGKMVAFDPDLVFFIGLNSSLIAPLFQVRPVLGLCVHSIPPMAPVDVWLSSDKTLDQQKSDLWSPSMPEAFTCYHPYRIRLKPISSPVTRSTYGIDAEAIVLVSVGYRLGSEIDGEWAQQMVTLLAQHTEVVWLLVGVSQCLTALQAIPSTNIRLIDKSEDVRSIYRICDVVVNPPRLGGGFSVAEAMAEGLPVVSFADSDGGNKVGVHAVRTSEEYLNLLSALIDSTDLRHSIGASMKSIFSNTLDLDQSGPSLLAACEQTLQRYQLRTNKTDSS